MCFCFAAASFPAIMSLNSLAKRALVAAVVRSRSLVFEANCAGFHSSYRLLKKKRPFYNKYVKQIQNRNRIYTGYANEVLQKQSESAFEHSEDIDDEDFEEELLSEGRKRRGAYIHSRKMREITKGPGPRVLTWEQMEHIRFLAQTDPEEWSIEMLSHSFQVPEVVIRKVLRSKRLYGPQIREKLDAKAHANHSVGKLSKPLVSKKSPDAALVPTGQKQTMAIHEQWGLPHWKDIGWFSGYGNAMINTAHKDRIRDTESRSVDKTGVSWLEDEELEFYSYLYRAEETWWGGDDSSNPASELEDGHDNELDEGVTTALPSNPDSELEDSHDDELDGDLSKTCSDGRNFYVNGEMIYKI